MSDWTVRCNDSRDCFLKVQRPSGVWGCPLLTTSYEDGKCPFAKAKETDIAYHTLALREKGGEHDRSGNTGSIKEPVPG